ncbi:hypothetical protein F5148DRAFT_1147903 [Russula earlei]|uniref:Uncharacterized protein n=1 Tax=Russula earlei TaxID=71964 RepID=A0ACC0UDW5_9AGAM|nr:hypothetical protein F5148DRAFT_1147903 [Russula earlei]
MTGNIEYPRRERAPMRSWTQAQRGVLKPVREGDTKACLSFQRGFRPYASWGVEILSIPSQTFLTELWPCAHGLVVLSQKGDEAMAAARVRVVVREGGGVERHGHSNEVFTTAGGGSTCGCSGRGGMCGMVLALAASPVAMLWWWGLIILWDSIVASASLRWQHLSVHSFLTVRGGITARDRSVRAAWSGSRVVAGTRPGMVADKAEGVVATAGCAGNTVDVTEEAEAEAAEDKTGMETGDKEAAAG